MVAAPGGWRVKLRAEQLHDAAARQRIAGSLEESLLVEAAAGTGKTTVLVERVVALLASGLTTVDKIVAVTFTRKAAGELELRLRQELDLARAAAEGERRRRLSDAIARLEEASIGTLHSFCAEILRARPVEAGIDPAFVELDEEQEGVLFERVFRAYLERQLELMPEGLRRGLARLAESAAEAPLERLLQAARELAAWRDFPARWRRDDFAREQEADALLDVVEATLLLSRQGRGADPLRRSLIPAEEFAAALQRREQVAGRRDYDELEAQLVGLEREVARKENWRGKGEDFAPGLSRTAMLAARGELLERLADFRRRADADLAALLQSELGEAVAQFGVAKKATGRLDFLDLLLCCRDLLRGNAEVRQSLRERFSHFFVDEAQDTDPLQMEILLLLASDDPAENDWRRVRPRPGRLFLVGDPKQSIYRFRRADVLLYLAVRQQLEKAGVAVLELSHSFRATRNLQLAINASFGAHLRQDGEAGQPAYVALEGGRPDVPGQPSLVALPVPHPFSGGSRVTLKAVEASFPDALAAYLDDLLRHRGFRVDDGAGGRRPLEARDICLLFRRYQAFGRDVTAEYLRALEARHVPHLLIGGRSFAEREEVETLRVALTAIEWPEDRLAVYGTLRGDLFAIPDGELFRYEREYGPLRPGKDPAGSTHEQEWVREIAQALRLLAELHQGRNLAPIADTLSRLLVATRAHAGFALRPAGNQVLANVARVADLARRYEMSAGLSFRGFLERLEAATGQRGNEGNLGLEEGADGVRLMTVHAAKGLEFPVVALADPTCRTVGRSAPRCLDIERGLCAVRLLGLAPAELDEAGELEMRREAAEAVRLTYVAATRARDLLIVPALGSGHLEGCWLEALDDAVVPAAGSLPQPWPGGPSFGRHTLLSGPPPGSLPEVAPGLHQPRVGRHEVLWWDPALLELERKAAGGVDGTELLAPDEQGTQVQEGLKRYLEWQAEKAAAIDSGTAKGREVLAVTEIAFAPEGVDVRLELAEGLAEERPRGRRFGTLVHAVLRDLPLAPAASPDRQAIASLARLHGRALGAPTAEVAAAPEAIAALLAHPLWEQVRQAAKVRREVPFTLRLEGDFLVEGVIDLLFEDEQGLTIVDFKTDHPRGEVLAAYLRQLAWYVVAAERLLGRPARGVLLALG